MSYSAFVLVDRNSDLDFLSILAELNEYEVSRLSETEALLNVGGYRFHVFYKKEDFVLEESEVLVSQQNNGGLNPGFKPSDVRVEIVGESDPDMDHFNDFILIIEKLSGNTSLAVYEAESENFI